MSASSPGEGLQVILTTGPEDPDRVLLAMNIALVAISSGVSVTLFLTLRASQWACARTLSSAGNEEIYSELQQLIDAGCNVECCTACLEKFCLVDENSSVLREGISYSGLAAVVRRATASSQSLVF